MARYKWIDTSPRFLAVDLAKQLLPGSFEHAVHHLFEHEIDLGGFAALPESRTQQLSSSGVSPRQPPAEYFLLTFTLPAELRPLAFRHAEAVYTALFAAAWATVQAFCRNDRQLKGEAGAVAVLHTHSRRLDLHPHVHLLMPGASLDAKSRRWRSKRGYLFNHRALAKAFRKPPANPG